MNNNDIFKKLRVALQLRDDQIVEILELVDFRISKAELGAFFRNADHPNYMDCGDQVLRNFLNGLVIYLRGTKEDPKDPREVLAQHQVKKSTTVSKERPPAKGKWTKTPQAGKSNSSKTPAKKPHKSSVVEPTKYKNGKK